MKRASSKTVHDLSKSAGGLILKEAIENTSIEKTKDFLGLDKFKNP